MRRSCFVVACVLNAFVQSDRALAAHLYWTDGRSVHRAALDGSGAQTLVTPANSFPFGIAVDSVRGKIYWVNYFASEVLLQRANLDGSRVENLIMASRAEALGWGRPHSLALDETGAASGGVPKLYLGETDAFAIKRVNLDGGGVEAIATGLPNDSYVLGIAIDTAHRTVYWATCCPDSGPPSISRAQLDGAGFEEIVLIVDPEGVALDVLGGKVYWASSDTASIWRANFDGSQRERVVTNAGDSSPIAINRATGKIYWADSTSLWQANLDGSARERLVAGTDRIFGIAVEAGVPPQSVALLALTNVWRYEQSGIDLGTAWRNPLYNDAVWPEGEGVLGVDNHPNVAPLIRTPLALDTNGLRTITYYFRTHFHVSTLNPDFMLVASNLVDDGAIFYLNGQEIFRQNMPGTIIEWQTRASQAVATPSEGVFVLTNLPATHLVQGDNVLAVEVHQVDASSTDVVFGMVLLYAPQTPLHVVSQPPNGTTHEGSGITLSGKVAGGFPRFQWFKDDWPIPGAASESLSIPNLQRADAGHYHFVATNHLGAVTSDVATVTLILLEHTNAPVLLSAGAANDNGGGLIVIFNSAVETPSSLNPANYVVTRPDTGEIVPTLNVAPYGVNSVRLFTGPLTPGTNYVLTVNNVTNAFGAAVAPDSRVSIQLPLPLVSLDAVWKYNDSGDDLGTGWRAPDFSDATWPSGPALLYNDENFTPPPGTTERTLLNVTNAAGTRIVTHYFRHRFTLTGTPVNARLDLRCALDDGAVFYLNGQELGRFNMPAGPVDASTRARTSATEGAFSAQSFLGTNLVAGENVLAVEVHQFSLMSPNLPDISFGLEASMDADSFATLLPQVLRHPENLTAAEREPASFFCDILAATHLQWLRDGAPIPGAASPRLDLPMVSPVDGGATFALVGSNALGAVTSRVALLSVIADLEPPQLLGANMGTNTTQIIVTFSEPLDPVSAGEVGRYTITNQLGATLPILSATLTNNHSVLLLSAPRASGDPYILTADGVRDASAQGNPVNDSIPIGYEVLHLSWDSHWRYDESGTDLGFAWREPDYNDAAWPIGPGLLGFEEPLLAEPIRTMLTPPEFRGPVYYFRTRFSFTPHPEADAVWLRHLVDDGAVFFLNGREVHRVAVPLDQNYQTLATRGWEAVVEGPFDIPRSEFLPGPNVLAVEVHQTSTVSADIVFGAQLTESFDVQPLRPVRPRLHLTRAGPQLILSWDDLSAILESAATPLGPWQRAPAPTLPYAVNPSSDAQFYRLRR